MTIGERLNNLRKLHEFDINDMADFLELTVDDVKSLENNTRKLKVSQLERLCDLYNVDEDYIVEGKAPDNYSINPRISRVDINTTYLINRAIRNIAFINSLKYSK